jgi:hypothetical protein
MKLVVSNDGIYGVTIYIDDNNFAYALLAQAPTLERAKQEAINTLGDLQKKVSVLEVESDVFKS